MIQAVSNANGRRWRVEGPGWTMQPEGTLTADEAEQLCRAAARGINDELALLDDGPDGPARDYGWPDDE